MLPLWIKALPVQKPRKNVHGWDPTTAEQTGKRWILIFQFDFLYSYYVSCIIKVKLLGTMLKIWYFNLVYQLNTQSSCPGTCSCTGHRLASSHQVGENPPWRPGVQAGGIPGLHDWETGRQACIWLTGQKLEVPFCSLSKVSGLSLWIQRRTNSLAASRYSQNYHWLLSLLSCHVNFLCGMRVCDDACIHIITYLVTFVSNFPPTKL